MFTLLFLLPLVIGLAQSINGETKRKPCCQHSSSSSSSSSDDCAPCPQIPISVESNGGAYPLYYGLPNSGFTSGYSFVVNSGPLGGLFIAWDCYCAGDKFAIYLNGELCADYLQQGVTDDQCADYETSSRNCLLNTSFYQNQCILEDGNTLYNITIIQQSLPYGGGSGFVTYLDYQDTLSYACNGGSESIWACNLEPHERTYPCDFGN